MDIWKQEPSKAQSLAMVSEGAGWPEAYCLTMRVTRNAGPMVTEEDLEVPLHSWSEGIVRDFAEYHLGLPPRVITVELLSDMEFLMLQGCWSKCKGMTWDQSIQYIRQMHGVTHWVSTEVHITASQHTIIENWKNLANS